MSGQAPKGSPFTARHIRRGIKLDRVNPTDFQNLNLIYCCEQCTYFDPQDVQCVLGFPCENHTKDQQLQTFSTSGHMAFCRFLEID